MSKKTYHTSKETYGIATATQSLLYVDTNVRMREYGCANTSKWMWRSLTSANKHSKNQINTLERASSGCSCACDKDTHNTHSTHTHTHTHTFVPPESLARLLLRFGGRLGLLCKIHDLEKAYTPVFVNYHRPPPRPKQWAKTSLWSRSRSCYKS
jgi:hypothetical protein